MSEILRPSGRISSTTDGIFRTSEVRVQVLLVPLLAGAPASANCRVRVQGVVDGDTLSSTESTEHERDSFTPCIVRAGFLQSS